MVRPLKKSFLDKKKNKKKNSFKFKKRRLQPLLLGPVQTPNFSCVETNAQITKINFRL